MKRAIDIGVLYSESGLYAPMASASLQGTLQGVREVNGDDAYNVSFNIIARDPKSRLDRYAPLCREILREYGVKHIFGCITSASRKEVIPELERYNGVLWYNVPYEGFEASERVAYTHSCPNQHLLPLLNWSLNFLGKRAYLVGSNYIWGWEMAQIARERISAESGQVLGDRYVSLGDVDIDHIVDEVVRLQPDFILNSLVGESSYAFLKRLQAVRHSGALRKVPTVLSCNFTECEIEAAGEAAEGLISAGPWFEPAADRRGSFYEMARQSVHELARLMTKTPGAEALSLSELITTAARHGYVSKLDPAHHHAKQPVKIVRLEQGRFVEIASHDELRADPYLTQKAPQPPLNIQLRVVS